MSQLKRIVKIIPCREFSDNTTKTVRMVAEILGRERNDKVITQILGLLYF